MFGLLTSRNSMQNFIFIYPIIRIPVHSIQAFLHPGVSVGSAMFWINVQTFSKWAGNVFALFLAKNDVKLVLILYENGQNTHLVCETSKLCKYLRINLIVLYPNAIHILHLCIVANFHPLKVQLKKAFFADEKIIHMKL